MTARHFHGCGVLTDMRHYYFHSHAAKHVVNAAVESNFLKRVAPRHLSSLNTSFAGRKRRYPQQSGKNRIGCFTQRSAFYIPGTRFTVNTHTELHFIFVDGECRLSTCGTMHGDRALQTCGYFPGLGSYRLHLIKTPHLSGGGASNFGRVHHACHSLRAALSGWAACHIIAYQDGFCSYPFEFCCLSGYTESSFCLPP